MIRVIYGSGCKGLEIEDAIAPLTELALAT
jgi:hypothetical protein